MKTITLLFFSIFLVSGCGTTQKNHPSETPYEAISAAENVLSTVSGQEIDDKKLRELNRKIQKDPEAKTAVETIANSVSGQAATVKYCPVDGERYSPKFEECPVHKVKLEKLEP